MAVSLSPRAPGLPGGTPSSGTFPGDKRSCSARTWTSWSSICAPSASARPAPRRSSTATAPQWRFPRHPALKAALLRRCPGQGPQHQHVPLKGSREGTSTTRCTEAGVYAEGFVNVVASVLLATVSVEGGGKVNLPADRRHRDAGKAGASKVVEERYEAEEFNEEEAAVAEEAGILVGAGLASEMGAQENGAVEPPIRRCGVGGAWTYPGGGEAADGEDTGAPIGPMVEELEELPEEVEELGSAHSSGDGRGPEGALDDGRPAGWVVYPPGEMPPDLGPDSGSSNEDDVVMGDELEAGEADLTSAATAEEWGSSRGDPISPPTSSSNEAASDPPSPLRGGRWQEPSAGSSGGVQGRDGAEDYWTANWTARTWTRHHIRPRRAPGTAPLSSTR